MAGGLLAGLTTKALGASKIAGASKVAGASKIGIMPKTFGGAAVRSNILSSLGGGSGDGGGISASNFASSSMRSMISNIGGSVDTSGGLGDMLTSESIMGRRTGQDTTQDFLDTFGSDKTGKVIRSSLMVLRDTFVETFETARILRTALNQTDGLGGGKGGDKKKKGGGLLGMLGGLLTSPLGMVGAGIGGGILAKKFGGLKGLKGMFGGAKKTSKVAPKALKGADNLIKTGDKVGDVVDVTGGGAKVLGKNAASKVDDAANVAQGTAKVTQNVTKTTNVVKEGIKKGGKGGGILGKGKNIAKNLFKNPKKALGAGILGIGGLALGGIGMHVAGRIGEDTWDKFDGVIDKFDSVLDDQESSSDGASSDGEGGEVISTSSSTSENATLKKGKVVSGNMSQADAEKYQQKLKLEKAKFDAISTHGYKSPEANEIRKKLMVLGGTPEEAIYTDKKGNLKRKGYSTYGGKTTVSNKKVSNKKGGGLFGGIKRAIGGAADISTMGMFDFDKRSGGGLLRKTAGAVGSGIKRGIGGALDFATLGMFDFDKRNRKGAPKGFGLKRIMGGVADAITMGTTDFDKRGAGIGQYSGFTGRRGKRNPNQKRINEILTGPASHEAGLELKKLGYPSGKINFWMRKKQMMSNLDDVPMTTTENPDGSITSKGSGRKIAGELFTPGKPLSEKQYNMIKISRRMGNRYDDDVIKSYNLYDTELKRVKVTPQNTSVPQNPNKNPKIINVQSSSTGADNNSGGGGGIVNSSGSSGAGSNIAFPPSHNGVSYAAVETQSQMNLVMAD